jgi:hypothetical protein
VPSSSTLVTSLLLLSGLRERHGPWGKQVFWEEKMQWSGELGGLKGVGD